MDYTPVVDALRLAAEQEILPRWRTLADGDVRTKTGPDDLVTDADVQAEHLLTRLLRDVRDVPVVGEEAATLDPSSADVVAAGGTYWLVDPVDGTLNFVAGTESFASMIALVEDGIPSAAWIYYPVSGSLLQATTAGGTFLDGVRLTVPAPQPGAALRGAIATRYYPAQARRDLVGRGESLGSVVATRNCAGWDYHDVCTGLNDFVLFRHTYPWDHAPGAVMARGAGLRVARLDGHDYAPGEDGVDLLIAHPAVWELVRDTLDVPAMV